MLDLPGLWERGTMVPMSVEAVMSPARCVCSFCSSAELGHEFRTEWWNTPLLETNNFVVWPSLGALVPGWLLLVPKRHALCLATLKGDVATELEGLESHLRSQLASSYGLPVNSFEHGPAQPGDPVSCTVDHAHMHVVPTQVELKLTAQNIVRRSWAPVTSLRQCLGIHERGLSYVYLRTPDGHQHALQGKSLPSQLMRRVIAQAFPREQWDWRLNHQLENVRDTQDLLRPVLAG